MIPFNLRIERKRGDTEELVLDLTSDKKPKNIVEHTFKLTVNKEMSPIDTRAQLFSIDAIIINPLEGKIAFFFTKEQVNFVGQFFFDIEMTKPNGTTRTISEGHFIFTQDITK